jgi:hypothetical protein
MRIGFALLLVACEVPRTQLMIGAATDIRAPDTISNVRLEIYRQGVIHEVRDWEITGSPAIPDNLPGSYGIYSPDGDEIAVELALVASKGTTEVVRREARLSLVPGKTLFFRMGLTAGCAAKTDCSPGDTCVEGVCRTPALDARQLPDFTEELVTTLTCNSGTTYIDTATGTPMRQSEEAGACPPDLCREGTCLKPLEGGGGGGDLDGGVEVPPDSTEPISCGEPTGDRCFNAGGNFCQCDATCTPGDRLQTIRCEGFVCTCTFAGEQTNAFDYPVGTPCAELFTMCPAP